MEILFEVHQRLH